MAVFFKSKISQSVMLLYLMSDKIFPISARYFIRDLSQKFPANVANFAPTFDIIYYSPGSGSN